MREIAALRGCTVSSVSRCRKRAILRLRVLMGLVFEFRRESPGAELRLEEEVRFVNPLATGCAWPIGTHPKHGGRGRVHWGKRCVHPPLRPFHHRLRRWPPFCRIAALCLTGTVRAPAVPANAALRAASLLPDWSAGTAHAAWFQ